MALSRKHFEAIAGILREQHTGNPNTHDYLVMYDTAMDLANYFATENPHFDRERFLKAAGVN